MGDKLKFLCKLYNNKYSYADSLSNYEIELLHINSNLEGLIEKYLGEGRIIFLTGNPGDGKTFLINVMKDKIDKYHAYCEPDANSVKDYNIIINSMVDSIKKKRPCIIAVNEYPLIQLLYNLNKEMPSFFNEINKQRENSIIYTKQSISTYENIIVLDLNNRNLLDPDAGLPRKILDHVIKLATEAMNEEAIENGFIAYNIQALSNSLIQERFLKILDMISRTGKHFVMRDILGVMSFIITAGDMCNSRYYYELLYSGKNSLFNIIRILDPIYFTHPEIDEKLWNGELTEGWAFDIPTDIPANAEEDKATEIFSMLKRRFYFENVNGSELYRFMPKEYDNYYSILTQDDQYKNKVKADIIQGINMFFNQNDRGNYNLRIWTMHKYDQSRYSRTATSSQYIDISQLDILIPRLPHWSMGMEYTPDHFVFRVNSIDGKADVDLKIDLDFLRVLQAVRDGYPAQLIPKEYEFKLFKFMNDLISGRVRKTDTNEIILLDRISNEDFVMEIDAGIYSFSRGR